LQPFLNDPAPLAKSKIPQRIFEKTLVETKKATATFRKLAVERSPGFQPFSQMQFIAFETLLCLG
jgi:hypothetical protein